MDPLVLIALLSLIAVSIIVYQYRHLFSFFRYQNMVRSVTEQVDRSRPLSPSSIQAGIVCPRCQDVMEEGYLTSPRGIYWNKDAFTLHNFGWHDLRSERLTSALPFDTTTPVLKAHRCRKCEIIRVDLKSQQYRLY